MKLFIFMLQMVFADRSMYMQMKTGRWEEGFCKNTYYRFLNSMKVNWERFCLLLSEAIIHQTIEPLTGKDRKCAFIVDDTLYRRYGYKKTELSAAVFDHVDMKTRRGFRGLTLGWSDGNTFIPVTHRLLSSPNDDKVLGPQKEIDGRTLAGQRRRQARRKATVVMVELLKDALKTGIKASYVLFDSWFSQPAQILQIKGMGLDTIAMVKKSGQTCYQWQGERLNIKQIYSRNRKRPGRSKYLLSVEVTVLSKDKAVADIPARLVYVRNRAKKKEWLAIICTDMSLTEQEIIPATGHTMTATVEKSADCAEAGNSAYWTCTSCNKYFSDKDGLTEIEENSWIIPATGHDWGEVNYEWTVDNTQITAARICAHNEDHRETEKPLHTLHRLPW